MYRFKLSGRACFARVLHLAAIAGAAMTFAAATQADELAHYRPDPLRDVNAVVHWNTIAGQAFAPTQGTNPMAQSRTLAILHASMHDALNAIEPRYASYTAGLPAAPQANPDTAVAAAAREVLVTLLPDQASVVDAAYSSAVTNVADGPGKTFGIELGQAAAWATLARRDDDGAAVATQPVYVPRSGVGEYQFTPPFDFAAQPGWGRVTPFAITLGEHALDGPQPLASAQYARDFARVKAVGDIASRTRMAEQSEIAKSGTRTRHSVGIVSPTPWPASRRSMPGMRGVRSPW